MVLHLFDVVGDRVSFVAHSGEELLFISRCFSKEIVFDIAALLLVHLILMQIIFSSDALLFPRKSYNDLPANVNIF